MQAHGPQQITLSLQLRLSLVSDTTTLLPIVHDADGQLCAVLKNGQEDEIRERARGHSRKTWLYEPRAISFRSKSPACYWPADFLPSDFPSCRILTYGYDSRVSHCFSGSANQTNILSHARAFVDEFEEEQRLGGLLLKAILRHASDGLGPGSNIINNMCKSLIGTIFLGTPHRGSDYARLGQTVTLAAKALQFDRSTSLLRDMKVDSSILEVLNDSFLKVVNTHQFLLVTIEEGRGLGIPLIARGKVVPPWSAHLGLHDATEQKNCINANHMKMCRFKGRNTPGYGTVRRAIDQCLRRGICMSGIILHLSFFYYGEILDDSADATFEEALRGLYTPETRLRYDSLEQAYRDTYEWIFNDPTLGFQNWLSSTEQSLYWIRGKPASGKSTLMKLVFGDERTTELLYEAGRRTTMAALFFHDRGSTLQKNLEGLMREILHTLLIDVPELQPLYAEACHAKKKQKFTNEKFEWDWEITQPLFQRILEQKFRRHLHRPLSICA
ncbi:hypothetical protein EJ04DRAFT_520028 [Polyplosphaeria fusca]|uniref:Nephrocystin 3-like N-terminal domain-containing protein n=1 Tax=Polyplosphaeria fusca TaxID=682080 RepID=A0A9P4V6U2_9PLEO|nr:hypothetical protein EJ04DRAFT_520028 [Polyplosphaeria fusca]